MIHDGWQRSGHEVVQIVLVLKQKLHSSVIHFVLMNVLTINNLDDVNIIATQLF